MLHPDQHALVISFSNLDRDPRVTRQISLLTSRFRVTAAGYTAPTIRDVEFVPVSPRHWSRARKAIAASLLKARLFENTYWSSESVTDAMRALSGRLFDLIIANDILALPLALKLKGTGKVLLDAHEFAPLEFEESWRWRFFFKDYNEYLCQHYIPMADAAITVGEGIAQGYRSMLGVSMGVVTNAPPYQDIRPSSSRDNPSVRLVHHGAALPSRQLESMIEAMRHVDERFSLDFILTPTQPQYIARLKKIARNDSRIRFLPPVEMSALPKVLNGYDVGVYLLKPNNFNNRYSLPNKFFDFVQARLAIAVGPSPEMAAYVNRYQMGVVSEDFSPASFAGTLSALDRSRVNAFKAKTDVAARELCFEKAGEVFMDVIRKLLST